MDVVREMLSLYGRTNYRS